MRTVDTMELWSPDRLTPYERNSRVHTDEQVRGIAASIAEFGFLSPIVVDTQRDRIAAGHGRLMAARLLGMDRVPVVLVDHLTPEQFRAYVIADNQHGDRSSFDRDILANELRDLDADGFDLAPIGFSDEELADLLADDDEEGQGDGDGEDSGPSDAPDEPVTIVGDVWELGDHRVMCGDSTRALDVARLMDGQRAALLHADPPYGMGKEAEGVQNDNLRGSNLDEFQMSWWRAYRQHLDDNASAYVWGNAPDLWRLWYVAGLGSSEVLEFRNEIVWDKETVSGMRWAGAQMFMTASERCLFFQIGEQFLGAVNSDQFPETWAPVLAYFEGEARAAAITPADVRRVCGVGMYSHWFSPSQFTLMPEKHYDAMRAAYPGRFLRAWSEVKSEWDEVKSGPQSEIQHARSYFDNTHDAMADTWRFPRVLGDERHGHATPKPVAMMERIMRSSAPDGGLCVEPFGGSGSTLIGAEKTGRVCYTMELTPAYVDVIVERWERLSGREARLSGTGETFAEVRAQRLGA